MFKGILYCLWRVPIMTNIEHSKISHYKALLAFWSSNSSLREYKYCICDIFSLVAFFSVPAVCSWRHCQLGTNWRKESCGFWRVPWRLFGNTPHWTISSEFEQDRHSLWPCTANSLGAVFILLCFEVPPNLPHACIIVCVSLITTLLSSSLWKQHFTLLVCVQS